MPKPCFKNSSMGLENILNAIENSSTPLENILNGIEILMGLRF